MKHALWKEIDLTFASKSREKLPFQLSWIFSFKKLSQWLFNALMQENSVKL